MFLGIHILNLIFTLEGKLINFIVFTKHSLVTIGFIYHIFNKNNIIILKRYKYIIPKVILLKS
jgi:hypothetical protein